MTKTMMIAVLLLSSACTARITTIEDELPDSGKDARGDVQAKPAADAGLDAPDAKAPWFGGFCELDNGTPLQCNQPTEMYDVSEDGIHSWTACSSHVPLHCPKGYACKRFDPNSDASGGIDFGVCK